MRCEDFTARMQALLDQHLDPSDDRQIAEHARRCAPCDHSLRSWRRLAHAIASDADPQGLAPARSVSSRKARYASLAVAAALLLVAALRPEIPLGPAPPAPEPLATHVDLPPLDLHSIGSRLHQPEWWGSVVVAAWKPVDPLAEGLQPITESFVTAFEVLTPQGGRAARSSSGLPLENTSASCRYSDSSLA